MSRKRPQNYDKYGDIGANNCKKVNSNFQDNFSLFLNVFKDGDCVLQGLTNCTYEKENGDQLFDAAIETLPNSASRRTDEEQCQLSEEQNGDDFTITSCGSELELETESHNDLLISVADKSVLDMIEQCDNESMERLTVFFDGSENNNEISSRTIAETSEENHVSIKGNTVLYDTMETQVINNGSGKLHCSSSNNYIIDSSGNINSVLVALPVVNVSNKISFANTEENVRSILLSNDVGTQPTMPVSSIQPNITKLVVVMSNGQLESVVSDQENVGCSGAY